MPDSIKQQIMDRILADLAPLKPATFREITREFDPVKDGKALPALMVHEGPKTTTDKTETQWTPADSNPVHRTTLKYTVEYKRKIGDPTLIS